jgi:hypothetical protein
MKIMQQLESENVNTPLDVVLVPCNCGLQLNRDESLGVVNKKTFFNNPEGHLPVLEDSGTDLESYLSEKFSNFLKKKQK